MQIRFAKEKGIFPPADGWEPYTWYLGEASISTGNPIFEVMIFTGFLEKGMPSGYSGFFATNVCPEYVFGIHEARYLKATKKLFTSSK